MRNRIKKYQNPIICYTEICWIVQNWSNETVVVVRWQDKNYKEAREETKWKFGRVYRGGKYKMKRIYKRRVKTLETSWSSVWRWGDPFTALNMQEYYAVMPCTNMLICDPELSGILQVFIPVHEDLHVQECARLASFFTLDDASSETWPWTTLHELLSNLWPHFTVINCAPKVTRTHADDNCP